MSSWEHIDPVGTNYWDRHFYGQHSLARSFWINCVALNLFVGVLAGWFGLMPQALSNVAMTALLILGTVVLLPWQLVGLWRSAKNGRAESGRWFWPALAQAWVMFQTILALIVILGSISVILS